MAGKRFSFLLNFRFILAVYVLAAIICSVHLVALGTHEATMPKNDRHSHDIAFNPEFEKQFIGKRFTDYNNYVIFRQSYFHLIKGADLYTFYPDEQWDLYKYSPTFALFFAPFAYLPDMLGLSLWNILNALVLFLAIRLLPFKHRQQALLLWFILYELITCLQNAQSNALLAGLVVAAYACMQRSKMLWAALWLVAATFIKIYGGIGFFLFLLFPDKIKFILYSILWTVVFLALPLLVTPLHTLVFQYQSWAHMLGADQAASYGMSLLGVVHSWFGVNNGKDVVMIIGLILFLVPFIRLDMYHNEVFRLQLLAFMLVWVIIFNHKAESSTYIIAVTGIAIWYFLHRPQLWRTLMLWFVFVVTCLSQTDVFPPVVRANIFEPYAVKAVPCIIVWTIMFVELMRMKRGVGISYSEP